MSECVAGWEVRKRASFGSTQEGTKHPLGMSQSHKLNSIQTELKAQDFKAKGAHEEPKIPGAHLRAIDSWAKLKKGYAMSVFLSPSLPPDLC